jgi:hypothetical protein
MALYGIVWHCMALNSILSVCHRICLALLEAVPAPDAARRLKISGPDQVLGDGDGGEGGGGGGGCFHRG